MPKFTVQVYRDWREYGEIEIDAGADILARMSASDALEANSPDIEWEGITNTERVKNSETVGNVVESPSGGR